MLPTRARHGATCGGAGDTDDAAPPIPRRSRAISVAHTCLHGTVSNRGQSQWIWTPPAPHSTNTRYGRVPRTTASASPPAARRIRTRPSCS